MPEGEILSQSYEGIVNGSITVGVETTKNVSDGGRTLTVRLVGGEALVVHGIQDPSLNGL